ncbi:hypothetical protein TSOC_007773 [Tetrabaena socialis]|uniref:Sec7/BIG1-like C-terminal domain-containing protein n=1 Tax=Tetrabaena socialis TaxID=47790 RepID=A0A2J8A089_9CHLO|nr:hypothetical protein TSOC_007773 [Tetrabaena socialis]|eukprot:PNH05929.1 hypothetical protein TSOC_007773 [Tetrabaena socialis]
MCNAHFASFSPLALSSLVALGELEEPTFRKHVAELFPLLTQLIRADYAPPGPCAAAVSGAGAGLLVGAAAAFQPPSSSPATAG